jgi:demethylspheroidene O-methyltransferase
MSKNIDTLSLKTKWVMRRNAILGSAAFQRWASRTPIIRGIARRRAAAQFDILAGFVYTQVLFSFVEAGLIDYLNGHLRRFDDVAAHTGLGMDATGRLLKAGAALQLAESPQSGLWTLGETGAPLSANPGAIAMIRHHPLLYKDLADPLALLRADRGEETALSAYWTYAAKGNTDPADAAPYSALMAATQPMVSAQILDAYDFAQHRRMLDIGGGSGAFVQAIGSATPSLQCGLFDLPDVIAVTQKRLAGMHDSGRVALHAGSFKTDALPHGYDLITLVRICHDHDDDVVKPLLTSIYNALPPGGRLLIVEPMANAPHAARMGDAYFGLYLWVMGSGRPRPIEELSDYLRNAGFARVTAVKTALPIITSALVAIK